MIRQPGCPVNPRRRLEAGPLAAILLAASLFILAACSRSSGPSTGAQAPASQSAGASAGANRSAAPGLEGKIAYAQSGNIWVYSGASARQMTTSGGMANPAWSPDGSQLAFDREEKNSADLYVLPYPQGSLRALSNNTSRIVENNLWEMQPDWSPDGSSIVYVSDRGRVRSGTLDPAPWRLTVASGARTQLASTNAYTGGADFPKWRPKGGNEILYTLWSYNPETLIPYGQLRLLNLSTNRATDLTPPDETSFEASWSFDGEHIAFIRRTPTADELWIMAAPGATGVSSQTPASARASTSASGLASTAASASASPAPVGQALVGGTNAHPAWAPSGRAIAYVSLVNGSFDLFVQRLTPGFTADGAPQQLTHGAHLDAASAIAWGP